jgi:hypothetical protein
MSVCKYRGFEKPAASIFKARGAPRIVSITLFRNVFKNVTVFIFQKTGFVTGPHISYKKIFVRKC